VGLFTAKRPKSSAVAVELGFALARSSEHKAAGRLAEALRHVEEARVAIFGDDVAALRAADASAVVEQLETREKIGGWVALLAEEADLAQRRGETTEARRLYERALAIQERHVDLAEKGREAIQLSIRALRAKLEG
jgi:tetratricopeptide (TPR) repeat protein